MEIPPIPQIPPLSRDYFRFGRSASIKLRVVSQSKTARIIAIRGLTKSASFDLKQTTSTDGTAVATNFPIDDIPVVFRVVDTTGALQHGECFVSVSLLVNDLNVFELASGFVTAQKGLSWPASYSNEVIPGRGHLSFVTTADPAANAEISQVVPANERWRILGAHVQLITDANVANRRVHFRFEFSSVGAVYTYSPLDQAASTTYDYFLAPYGADVAAVNNNRVLVNIPAELWAEGEGYVKTATLNRQATDNFGVMTIRIERFFL